MASAEPAKDDPSWLDALRRGEEPAFERLLEEQQDRVVNICYQFVRSRNDAEDVAQEVFVEVFRSIGRFEGASSLGTWIYRIAVSRSLDLLRERKRKKRSAVVRDLQTMKEEEGFEPAAPASWDPAAQVVETDEQRILAEAVAALPEKQRIAITLMKFDDLTAKEAAEVMGMSVTAVEALVHRGMKGLRRILEGQVEPD